MPISRLTELKDGKYKVLSYPDFNRRPYLVALEKLNPGRQENDFFIFNRDKNDQPKFLSKGTLIFVSRLNGTALVRIEKSIVSW
ncbi:MAG: hypothetical protein V1865_01265 [bacterium]